MRHARTLTVFTLMTLSSASLANAQVLVGGDVRVRTTDAHVVEGTFIGYAADSMVIGRASDTLRIAAANVRRLHVRTPYRINGRRALIGAGVGTLAAVALGSANDASGGELAVATAVYATMGAALGGGGSKALRAGGRGALILAAPIGLLAAVTYEPCEGWCIGPESGAEAFVWGAAAGAATGFLVGSVIGALTPGTKWNEIPVDVGVTPSLQGGMQIGASVAF